MDELLQAVEQAKAFQSFTKWRTMYIQNDVENGPCIDWYLHYPNLPYIEIPANGTFRICGAKPSTQETRDEVETLYTELTTE